MFRDIGFTSWPSNLRPICQGMIGRREPCDFSSFGIMQSRVFITGSGMKLLHTVIILKKPPKRILFWLNSLDHYHLVP